MLLELVNRSIQMTELERGAAVEKGISSRPLPELRVGHQASCRNHVECGVGNVNGGGVRLLQIPQFTGHAELIPDLTISAGADHQRAIVGVRICGGLAFRMQALETIFQRRLLHLVLVRVKPLNLGSELLQDIRILLSQSIQTTKVLDRSAGALFTDRVPEGLAEGDVFHASIFLDDKMHNRLTCKYTMIIPCNERKK